jgi:hypothetical protein
MPRLLGSLALIGLAACSNRPHAEPMPILLQGEPMAAMPSLSGDWSGGYWNGSAGRHGSLKFFVGIGEDSTFGDVTMVSPYGDRPQPADQGAGHRAHTRLAQVLRMDFVRATDGAVTGTLEPYISPECVCTVTTTFSGTIAGDTIRGAFLTRGPAGETIDGQWKLVRRSARIK